MREFAQSLYKSKAWQKCRYGFLASKNWTCERCGGLATIAHHKKHVSPQNVNDLAITMNWDNLEALCMDCHNVEHMSKGTIAKGLMFTADGDIIQAPQPEQKQSARETVVGDK